MIRVALVMILVFSAVAQAQGPGKDDSKHIVRFRPGTSQAERVAAVQRAGGKVKFNYSIVDAAAITVSNPNVLAALQREPSVADIVPDREVHAIQGPHDIGISRRPAPVAEVTTTGQVTPQGVIRVGAPTATSNGNGIGVAIVDTGIDLTNKDLTVSSLQYAKPDTSCQDDNGHGTHVSGIVAANGTSVIGVAPRATLYCVKVLNSQGSGEDSDVIAGLQWVHNTFVAGTANPQIRVVNMSLGRDGSVNDNPALRAAVYALYHNDGITVVVAAGNDPTQEVKNMVPASYPEVLAVASTTAKDGTNACRRFPGVITADTASYFTTDGAYLTLESLVGPQGVTISAPGEDQENISKGCFIASVGILSTKLGGGTTRMSGTSMASPHVAGVVARMIQSGMGDPENIRITLRADAQHKGEFPLGSPTSSYTFDQELEGIAKAPAP